MSRNPVAASHVGSDANPPRLVLVSHGYENIYERGFCNGLTDSGTDYTLISSDRTDYAGMRRRAGTRFVNLRGSQDESRPRWRKLINLLAYHTQLMAYVMRNRQAVVHVVGLIHPAWLCGVIQGLWFRLFARRYVVTAHDLVPHDRNTALNRLLFGLSYRLADRVVVHTARTADELVEFHHVDPSRIIVMAHGLEPMAERHLRLAERAPQEPLHILFFGKVMRYKGIDLLLEALAQVPFDFTLRIAGICRDGELAAELRRRIETHPRREAISWPNEYVQEAEIEPLFTSSHLLVLPYRRIDQSGVLFQALRFGLPVVASRVGSFAEFVTPEVGELCEADSAPALRDAIVRARDRQAELDRRRIVELGRAHEWQNTVTALREAYA